jgi:hypothetical protein
LTMMLTSYCCSDILYFSLPSKWGQ